MKKGTIWLVDLQDGKGHEQKGQRPCIILGAANGIITVIPLTTNLDRMKLSHTHLFEPSKDNGLTEPSVALAFQIVSLDQTRFKKKIGWIPNEQRDLLDDLILSLLKLKKEGIATK